MSMPPRFSLRRFAPLAWGLLCAVSFFPRQAANAAGITATVDASGKVVFVNSDPDDTSSAASAKDATVGQPAQAPASQPAQKSSPAPSPSAHSGLDSLIEVTARTYEVDPDLVRAIVQVESNFNPYAVSPKGARGLMQLIPATASRFGVRDVFDPQDNLDGGVRYLKYLMGVYGGDLRLSLAAYNAGEDAVAANGGVPPYRETQEYVRRILQLYPSHSGTSQQLSQAPILESVDNEGTVHFTNTDWP